MITMSTVGMNRGKLTLAALGKATRLPVEFLRDLGLHDHASGGIGITYYGMTGEDIAVKHLTAMEATNRNSLPAGFTPAAYGQWRLQHARRADFLILVENERSCWVLWYHHFPALGLQGAYVDTTLLPEHIEALGTIYIHQEPGGAGEKFVQVILAHLAALKFAGKVLVLRMPERIKDPANLHAAVPEEFKDRLELLLRMSTLVELSGAAGQNGEPEPLSWEPPLPLAVDYPTPPFPVDCLPSWLAEWVQAEAEATQTPPDLAAMLALAFCGAGLAKKYRVGIRDGWSEPTNLYTVTALPPGDRKSAVYSEAMAPVQAFEREQQAEMAARIAELACEHRLLETRLKIAEAKAAKVTTPDELKECTAEAKKLAAELAEHEVPDPLQVFCDDVTPEKLGELIARQGGRMLQASPEGTAFEIAKGRYSEKANFDVYLKGHAGDPLRADRVSRPGDKADQPALSVALAVQPDVIHGLADQATMRGRGFLARFLYSMPTSRVGARRIAPPPVLGSVSRQFHECMLTLWRLPGATDDSGRPAPHLLRFSPDADAAMRTFETWLEPLLAEGQALSYLAGWANKLAGAIARIAAILHVAEAIGNNVPWQRPVSVATVAAAIRLGRDYLLPHAQAAFGVMAADGRTEDARRVLLWVVREERAEFKRWELHKDLKSQGRFPRVEDLNEPLKLLADHGYVRLRPAPTRQGPGRPADPVYEVNPLWDRRVNRANRENASEEAIQRGDLPDSPDLPDEPERQAEAPWQEGEL